MNRFVMIDGLRGLGAVAIAIYHIFRYGPLSDIATESLPQSVQLVILNGWMSVQWFLIIAGLGAALSTHEHQLTLRATWWFAVRRLLRLGSMYWVAVSLTAALTIIAILGWDDRSLNEDLPSWSQYLAHLGFLHDILGFDCLTTGIWFVAILLQLDLVFVSLMAAAKGTNGWKDTRESPFPSEWMLMAWFGPLTLWSLFVSIHDPSTDMWFHHFLCMYVLGAVIGWTIVGRTSARLFWIYVAIVLGVLVTNFSKELLIALIAGMTIYLAWCGGRLETWLNWPVLQYLGRISYSLFLIHYPVSWLVGRVGFRLTGDNPVAALGWLVLAMAASVAAGHVLYNFVELPMLFWTRQIGRHRPPANTDSPPGAPV